MMLMAMHACAAGHQTASASDDSIRFIALPYLHAFHSNGHEPAITIRPEYQQDMINYQWRISAISIPAYREKTGILQLADSRQASGPRLSTDGYLIVPMPGRAAPLIISDLAQQPLWLHIFNTGISTLAWHPPALTPAASALAIAEKKRQARLAKRMAERAFYFGYDANNDALK